MLTRGGRREANRHGSRLAGGQLVASPAGHDGVGSTLLRDTPREGATADVGDGEAPIGALTDLHRPEAQ